MPEVEQVTVFSEREFLDTGGEGVAVNILFVF